MADCGLWKLDQGSAHPNSVFNKLECAGLSNSDTAQAIRPGGLN